MNLLLVKHGGNAKTDSCLEANRHGNLIIIDDDSKSPIDAEVIHVQNLKLDVIEQELKKRQISPDGVLTFVDPVITLTSEIADRYSLPGLTPLSAKNIKNKYEMRSCVESAGILSPRFELISEDQSLESAAEKVGYPCVLKPISAAFSLGIIRIDGREQITKMFETASCELRDSEFQRFFPPGTPNGWMVEEYLEGPEISVELLGHPENPQVIAIHEKVISENTGRFREDRFITAPWKLSHDLVNEIETEAIKVALALNFDRGVAHIEMRVTPKGIMLLELQACPAGGLISLMVEHSCGISLHNLHVRAFLQKQHETVKLSKPQKTCIMDCLYAPRPGYFRITGISEAKKEKGVLKVEIHAKEGKCIAPYAEYLGYACCEGSDANLAIENIERVKKEININVQPFATP